MDIVVREAVLDDAVLIADLPRNVLAGELTADLGEYDETTATGLQQGGGFILLINDRLAGCARWLPEDGNSQIWKIHHMHLLPEYQELHLSGHLLEAIIHHAQICEIRELHMALHPAHEALVDRYAVFDFHVAPEIDYPFLKAPEVAPIMLRRIFD